MNYWRDQLIIDNRHYPHVQPYLDFNNPAYQPPKWQKDLARWCGLKSILKTVPLMEYEPRKGFKFREYIEHPEIQKCRTKEEIFETMHPDIDPKDKRQFILNF